jgi:dolichyl-phosphate beta-glucosyltransferase
MHAHTPEREQDEPTYSLVFPTYNPGSALAHTWQAVAEFLRQAAARWEVLFVCDGCTDDTPARLRQWIGTESSRMRLLSYSPNRGKGYAVRQGLLAARGQWRLFTDVDLAYSFEDVLRLAETLQSGAEVAIASRWHPQSRLVLRPQLQGYAYRRHLQSLVFSTLVRLLLPLTQRDTQAGLKGMSAGVAERLVPRLHCDGFGFDCELLTACVRHGIPVAEVPVWVRYEDTASTTSVHTMGRMLRDLWKIRRSWRPGSVPDLYPGGATAAAAEPDRQAA